MSKDAALPTLPIGKIPNRPVTPEESPRYQTLAIKPVARRDLPRDFLESHMLAWHDYLMHNAMHDYEFCTALKAGTWSMFVNREEDGEKPGWREIAKKYAEQGLVLNGICGIRHGMEFAYGTGERVVPEDLQQFLLDTFGERFLGWENGEQDAEYVSQYVFGSYAWEPQSAERSRQEAHDDFTRFHRDTLDALFHHYCIPICSTGFFHYFAEYGHRLLGLEMGTGLMSTIVRWAFLRGASRQYDLLTWGDLSHHLCDPAQKPDFYSKKAWYTDRESLPVEFQLAFPDGGPSFGFFKRMWFAGYMYGASILGVEGAIFKDDVGGAFPEEWWGVEPKGIKPPMATRESSNVCDVAGYADHRGPKLEDNLTPLGREYRRWVYQVRARPERGVTYNPVAVVLQFHHGWMPPVHKSLGQSKPECVWGNIPYGLGDSQIDEFFRWVFPGYVYYGFSLYGRGCFTPTPFGDSFDVLLDNAPADKLDLYQAAVLLGEHPFDGDFEARLQAFVEDGKTAVLCTRQLTDGLAKIAGVRVTARDQSAAVSESRVSGVTYREGDYLYDKVEIDGAEVLAVNEAGDPLVCVKRAGKGRIFVVTPVFWCRGRRTPYHWHMIEGLRWDMNYKNDFFRGQPLPPPEILKVVQEILGDLFRSFELVDIDGRPIQYITNVTDDPAKLIVTLVNNSEVAWDGAVSVKGQEIVYVDEWLSAGESCIRDGALRCAVPADDVRIYELTCAQPFLEFA